MFKEYYGTELFHKDGFSNTTSGIETTDSGKVISGEHKQTGPILDQCCLDQDITNTRKHIQD
jgi:hypothetical protein